jgi:transcriptional regulator with XRE-family HTH domain
MEFRAKFGRTLRDLRRGARLTQEQLAEACGFEGQSRIGNYERGRGLPDIPDLLKLAQALHVDVCEFFGSSSRAARLDPEMIADVIYALNKGVAHFHEQSARDFVEYYELRAAMPSQPTTPRTTLEAVARAKFRVIGDERDSSVSVVGPAARAGRKGKGKG